MEAEGVIRRTPPNSLEAEQSVIGAMLMNAEALATATENLRKEDFYYKQYGMMFEAMAAMYAENAPVDPVTLRNKLSEMDADPSVADHAVEIAISVPTYRNIQYYAKIVRDKAVLRELIHTNEGIENLCYADHAPVEEILDHAEKDLFRLLNTRRSDDYMPIREIVMNSLKHIQKVSMSKSMVTGLATGFTDLDRNTAGLQPSDLVLIAARPSMGKTAFMLNIAEHVALRDDQCVALFSLEMSREQIVNRMFALESRVDSQHIRTGKLSDSEWEQLIEGASEIGKSKMIIDDTPGISVGELRSKCRKYKLEHDLKLVVIDYLQLMSGSGRGTDSRQQEISDISRSLKALARELEVPVVALSQLSRAVEQRQDHRPMLSDLRESGAIEQDADVVMFIYRDDYYNKDSEERGKAEIIIAKQRNGPVGTVKLAWLPQYTRFANLEMKREQG